MKRKAHGAQQPRHIKRLAEVASAAQRSDSPARAITQRFLRLLRRCNAGYIAGRVVIKRYRAASRQILACYAACKIVAKIYRTVQSVLYIVYKSVIAVINHALTLVISRALCDGLQSATAVVAVIDGLKPRYT